MIEAIQGKVIRLSGTVQGAGLRLLVRQPARAFALASQVCNCRRDLLIHVWGNAASRQSFQKALRNACPKLALRNIRSGLILSDSKCIVDMPVADQLARIR